MYYLQSRYYDPNTGRFLNADALISTGQGSLGNNMFVYCNNNPTCYCDPDGRLTRGQIHDLVLEKIIDDQQKEGRNTLSMTQTCIYKNGKNRRGGWGFCDLYDSSTGEVWELKRKTCSIPAAQKQLEGYTNGALKHHMDLSLVNGGQLMPKGEIRDFTYTDSGGTYHIFYWDNGDGILLYDYTYEKNTMKKVSDGLNIGLLTVAAAALTLTAVATYGATTPEVISVVIIIADRVSQTVR